MTSDGEIFSVASPFTKLMYKFSMHKSIETYLLRTVAPPINLDLYDKYDIYMINMIYI